MVGDGDVGKLLASVSGWTVTRPLPSDQSVADLFTYCKKEDSDGAFLVKLIQIKLGFD